MALAACALIALASLLVTLPAPPPALMRFESASRLDWKPCVEMLPTERTLAPLTTIDIFCDKMEICCERTLKCWEVTSTLAPPPPPRSACQLQFQSAAALFFRTWPAVPPRSVEKSCDMTEMAWAATSPAERAFEMRFDW